MAAWADHQMVREHNNGTVPCEGQKADTETEKRQGQDPKNLSPVIPILQASFTS